VPVPLAAPPVALECCITRGDDGVGWVEGVRWATGGRGGAGYGEGQQRGGGLGGEVRRKVVKVTVALTARARNNIGVRPSCATCGARARARVCALTYARHESCAARAENAWKIYF